MCRRRAVGTRSTPRASQTSWPWAQVSIRRAEMNESTPIGGPYHGTRAVGSASAKASTMARWAPPTTPAARRRPSAGPAPDGRPWDHPSRPAPPRSSGRRPSGSTMAMRPASSKKARWLIWSRTAHPRRWRRQIPPGVVVGQAVHHTAQDVVLGIEVDQQVGKRGHGTRLRQHARCRPRPSRGSGCGTTAIRPGRPRPPQRSGSSQAQVVDDHLDLRGRPHESFDGLEHGDDVPVRSGDRGESELTPLPLVLVTDLR